MRRSAGGVLVGLVVVCLGWLLSAGVVSAWASSGLRVHVLAAPSSFSEADNHECFENPTVNPGEFGTAEPCDEYKVIVTNAGEEAAGSPVVVSDALPAGLRVGASGLFLARNQLSVDEFEAPHGEALGECKSVSGGTVARCEFNGVLQPDQRLELDLRVMVEAGAPSGAENVVEVLEAGRSVAVSEAADVISAGEFTPPFAASGFLSLIDGADGSADLQAADHPYELVTELDVATGMGRGPETARRTARAAEGGVRDVVIDLPPGFVGSAQAAPKCALSQMQSIEQCPADSLVGHIDTEPSLEIDVNSPVYNLVPERGVAAELGFLDLLHGTHVIDATLAPTPQGYVVRAVAHETPNLLLWDVISTIYGDPAAKNGGAATPAAMFTNTADCSGQPPTSSVYVDSWQHPGTFTTITEGAHTRSVPDVEGPGSAGWAKTSYAAPPVTGCDELRFEPSFFSFAPEAEHSAADEPSGYESVLRIPQSETPETLATPPLKNTTVTLPAGVAISPSAAGGLVGCEETGPEGIDFEDAGEGHCPIASIVGEVEVATPLLEERLSEGRVFVAQPTCGGAGQEPCSEEKAERGEVFGVYVEVSSRSRGIHLKIKGRVEVGGYGAYSREVGLTPGQVRTSFLETPQAPFSELRFKFKGGPRAPLANPQSCGTFTTDATLEPWSAPQSGPAVVERPSFAITGGCASPFGPSFTAGTVSNQASAYSAFTTQFSRHDTEQDLAGVTVNMPEGLLAKIAGITQCPEAQANVGTCPASSKIGVVTAAAGSGSDPYWQSGSVYLTGPYNGGPFGLSIVVPAVAGPYNLGLIVTRASIRVNPATAQATIVSDPLPQSVDGVPIRLQTIDVTVGQERDFTFNATSCSEKTIAATLTSTAGAAVNATSRYQAAGCRSLPFHPDLTASTAGKTSKADGASLTVKVTAKPGEANIAKTELTIPKILPSRLTTLQQACTEAQFDANPAGCPAASDIATAVVHTPLLNSPLVGPAYFVSHGGTAFPDVEIVLQGEGVELVLDGHTQIKKGITYSRFETVPDAPFTTFEFTAPEGPYSIFTTERPGQTNLCALTKTVTTVKRVALRRHGHLVRRQGHVVRVKRKTTKHLPANLTIPTVIKGQNGARITQNTKVAVTGCPRHKPKKHAKHHNKHKHKK